VKRETPSSQRFPSLRLSLFHFHADPEESISEEKSIYKELQTAVHLSIIGSRFSTNRTADYMSNKYWGLIRIPSDHIQEIVKYLEALMVFNFSSSYCSHYLRTNQLNLDYTICEQLSLISCPDHHTSPPCHSSHPISRPKLPVASPNPLVAQTMSSV